MTLLFNNNVFIKNFVIKRNLIKIKVQQRWLMRAGKKAAEQQSHIIVEQKPVTRMFTRANHTVHYSPEKAENKQNSEPLENWQSTTETIPVDPKIKEELDKKYPIKHPKVVIDEDIANPEKKRHLTMTITHKLPKPYWETKYNFRVLASKLYGKDPKQPEKNQYLVVTNRVLSTTQANSAPSNDELTAYLKAHPEYPGIIYTVLKEARDVLAKNEKENKLTISTVVETQQSIPTNEVNNLKKEQPICFPLAEPKPLQIAPTPIALSPITPLVPPVVLPEQKATTTENIRNLAETSFSSKSSSNSSASGAKNLTNQNNDFIEKHST